MPSPLLHPLAAQRMHVALFCISSTASGCVDTVTRPRPRALLLVRTAAAAHAMLQSCSLVHFTAVACAVSVGVRGGQPRPLLALLNRYLAARQCMGKTMTRPCPTLPLRRPICWLQVGTSDLICRRTKSATHRQPCLRRACHTLTALPFMWQS